MAREQDHSTGASPTAAHFATTHWNLVFAAGHGGSGEAREAMAELCRIYWYPLYAYARCQGATADAAQDLTQGFFAHLLAHDLVASADAARGRFRSFLRRCLQNFAASEHARATRFASELADHRDPERLYERQWALAVIEEALRQLREEFVAAGRERTFDLLAPRLSGERDGVPAAELARQLGTTEGTVNVMMHRRRRALASGSGEGEEGEAQSSKFKVQSSREAPKPKRQSAKGTVQGAKRFTSRPRCGTARSVWSALRFSAALRAGCGWRACTPLAAWILAVPLSFEL